MALSDTAVRNAKPGPKPLKIFDERGLFLLVTPQGGKWWRFRYKYNEKEKLLTLGVYPDVSLKDARERREDARKLLAQGVDPGKHQKATKHAKKISCANSLEVVAREWIASHMANKADSHRDKVIRRFELYIFPWLGNTPISDSASEGSFAALYRISLAPA